MGGAGGEALALGDNFPGYDGAMLDKMGRLIARESYSKCDSDRRHGFVAVDYSQGSADFDGQENNRGSSDD